MEIKLSNSPKILKQFTWEERLTNLWWDGEPQRRLWRGEIGCLWLSQTESCCPSHQTVMAENKKSWILEIKARQEEEELWGSHADTKNVVCNRQICWAEKVSRRRYLQISRGPGGGQNFSRTHFPDRQTGRDLFNQSFHHPLDQICVRLILKLKTQITTGVLLICKTV